MTHERLKPYTVAATGETAWTFDHMGHEWMVQEMGGKFAAIRLWGTWTGMIDCMDDTPEGAANGAIEIYEKRFAAKLGVQA